MKRIMISFLGVTLTAGAAFAADAGDVRLLNEMKLSLIEAIEAAQKHSGGQALEAGLDDDSFKPAYEVSVTKDGRVFDVQVDGVNGDVLGMREDRDD